MSWSEQAWMEAAPIYNKILDMPYIRALMAGTLEPEKFKFYIAQDARYLEHYARVLAIVGARLDRKDHVLQFIKFAEGAIVVESALHTGYFEALGIDEHPPMAPACHHYTHYLLSTAATAPVEVTLGAVLPCFWVYLAAGKHILKHQSKHNNAYQTWIDTYAGNEFSVLVNKAITICDEVAGLCTAQQRERMTDAFLTGCRLEYMFWDSAWRLEQWPV
jgi:thiaminase (transcriptional activator TenA)